MEFLKLPGCLRIICINKRYLKLFGCSENSDWSAKKKKKKKKKICVKIYIIIIIDYLQMNQSLTFNKPQNAGISLKNESKQKYQK